MNTYPLLVGFGLDAFWAALAGLGFAMVFNIPRAALWAAVVAGALGHGVRFLGLGIGMNLPAASLVGAVAVGFWAAWCAGRFQRPGQMFAIAGVIPMIPGKFAYSTMIGLIKIAIAAPGTVNDLQGTLHSMTVTAMVLGALAFGIATPRLVFRRRDPLARAD